MFIPRTGRTWVQNLFNELQLSRDETTKDTHNGKPLTSVNTDACRTVFNTSLNHEQKPFHFIIFVCTRIQQRGVFLMAIDSAPFVIFTTCFSAIQIPFSIVISTYIPHIQITSQRVVKKIQKNKTPVEITYIILILSLSSLIVQARNEVYLLLI